MDWIDIGLHCLVSALACALALWLGPPFAWYVLALNVVAWPLRELKQHGWQWGGKQSQSEWIAPSGIGVLAILYELLR